VVEIDSRRSENGQWEDHFVVRFLESLQAGTSFPAMALRFAEVAKAVKNRTGSRSEVYVDCTGFGDELVTLIERHGNYSRVRPVYSTHGDRRTEEGGEVKLGKGWLVTRVQMLLQTNQLHLPRSPEAETLAQELMDFEAKPQPDNDLYGAFRVGSRDELVTALGLAVQRLPLGGMEHGWMPGFW
jgi:hypothetical protein